MDKYELANILKEMYLNAEQGEKVSQIHIFGMQYVNKIKILSNASEIVKLAGLNSSYSAEVSKGMKIEESLPFKINFKSNDFEARFNFPKEYQSILKPYLQYFEEFLNDLCIATDVNIQRLGNDTILSVIPENKNEALEKIADALKIYLCAPVVASNVSVEESLQMQTVATKLYAQCKNLESQMMYKEISIREQNQQIEIKDNIINESKRILVEAGVDTNIITHNNTMLLESLKSININNTEIGNKTFLNSIKASIKIPAIFSGSLELERKEFKKENND